MTISHRITMTLLWRTSIDSPSSRCQFFFGCEKNAMPWWLKNQSTLHFVARKNITWKLSLLLPHFLPLHSPGSCHKNIPKSYGKQKHPNIPSHILSWQKKTRGFYINKGTSTSFTTPDMFSSTVRPTNGALSSEKIQACLELRWTELCGSWDAQNWKKLSTTYRVCGGFLKWWHPTTMGFPTKNDYFGVFWGYLYFWKHPYRVCKEKGWKKMLQKTNTTPPTERKTCLPS